MCVKPREFFLALLLLLSLASCTGDTSPTKNFDIDEVDTAPDTSAVDGHDSTDEDAAPDVDIWDSTSSTDVGDTAIDCPTQQPNLFPFRKNSYLDTQIPLEHVQSPGPCRVLRTQPNSSIEARTTFSYNDEGRVVAREIRHVDTAGSETLKESVVFSYTDQGSPITSEQDLNGDGDMDLFWSHESDVDGARMRDQARQKRNGNIVWTYEYLWDQCGRLEEARYDSTGDTNPDLVVSVLYPNKAEAEMTIHEGRPSEPLRTRKYTYNENGALQRVLSEIPNSPEDTTVWTYSYGQNGKLEQRSQESGTPLELQFIDEFSYGEGDPYLERIVRRDDAGVEISRFSYDYSCWE
jgi:hypothetical protein